MKKGFRNASLIFAGLGFANLLGIVLYGFKVDDYWTVLSSGGSTIKTLLEKNPLESSAEWAYIFFVISFLTIIVEKVYLWWNERN